MLEMSEFVDDGMLATLFRNQLDHSSLMAEYLKQYDWENFKNNKQDDYNELYQLACQISDRKMIMANDKAILPGNKQPKWAAP